MLNQMNNQMNNQGNSPCRKIGVLHPNRSIVGVFCADQHSWSAQNLPLEIVNHIMLFRQTHPAAKIIQELKEKCNLCVVCMKNPKHEDNECCSSICDHQMTHDPCFDYPTFDGQKFERYVNEKHENGKWLDTEDDSEYWSNW